MRRTAVSALLVLLLVSGPQAPLIRVVGKRSAFSAVTNTSSKQDLTLLTYHGALEVGAEAVQVQVLLHVLVKVKQRADGSFKVRTVTYAERPEFAEGEDFAPPLTELSLTLEYEEGGAWQPLQLNELGVLQVQGPFVHEASVSENVAANELRLRIMDWPIFYTVSLPKLADRNLYGPVLRDSGPFQNAVVIGDIHGGSPTTAAKVLATHMAHHFALGFDMYLLYVRGSHLSDAVQANSVTSGYIGDGRLHIISLDALQIPQYDVGFREWAAYDPTKLIAYNHAALLLWGEHFRLSVLDIDELWSSKDEITTVNTWFDRCFQGFDIISAGRLDMICSDCLKRSESEMHHFEKYWDASDPLEVLQSFSQVAGDSSDPKSIFNPDKVGQVWLHQPSGLPGSKSALVAVSEDKYDLKQDCVFVVHLRNLFRKRVEDADTAVDRQHWLVHKHRNHKTNHTSIGTNR